MEKVFRFVFGKNYNKFVRFMELYSGCNISAHAGQTAFFIMLSFVPFLLLIFTLLNYTPLSAQDFQNWMFTLIPEAFQGAMKVLTKEIYSRSGGTITVAMITALWLSSKAYVSTEYGLNQVYRVKETRSYPILRLSAVFYSLIFALFIIAVLGIMVFGNQLHDTILVNWRWFGRIVYFRSIIVGITLFLFFSLLYYFMPNMKLLNKQWRLAGHMPGAFLAAVFWMVFSYVFSFYVKSYSNYATFYGTMTTIALIMVWLYFCMYMMFIGAFFNHLLYLNRKKKKERLGRMIYFNCDYNEGAHERIMNRLMETNMEQTIGYGCDEHSEHARELIRKAVECDDAYVQFLVGGTQTNMTVIASALRPHQGVIAASTGHINVHETGSIEATGHKVLAVPTEDGKITAKQIDDLYNAHVNDGAMEHTVQPKMVYISQPTELGTMYTLKELTAISEVCRANKLYLFLDGARLGYGLKSRGNDVQLPDLARLCDVFYIGGTKQGLLFGEAVVITNEDLKSDFRYMIKQRGGMLAKGRLLGVQFEAAFEDGLYMEMADHAMKLADKIRNTLENKNVEFFVKNNTNQIFPILSDDILKELSEKYVYEYQARVDAKRSAVRFCTSWATTEESVEMLCKDLNELIK